MLVRPAKSDDAPMISKAEQEIALEPGLFCSQPAELGEEAVRNTIASKEGVYLVVEKDGRLVGHAFLEVLPYEQLRHVGYLNIAIHKGFQNQGIGKLLMEKIIAWAKSSNHIEKIELSVRATNAAAIALYRKMGFVDEGLLKRHVKAGKIYFDDLLMGLFIK